MAKLQSGDLSFDFRYVGFDDGWVQYDYYCEWIGPEMYPLYSDWGSSSYEMYYSTLTLNTLNQIDMSALSHTEWYEGNYGTLAKLNRNDTALSGNATIQKWNPTGPETPIDLYRKTTPTWLQDVGTLNTVAKGVGLTALLGGAPLVIGSGILLGSSLVDVGTTGIEAFKYETKTSGQFLWQLGTLAATQGAATLVTGKLAASYLGADADLVGRMMCNGSQFYATYTASGMSRYLPNSYALSVVATEVSANAVEEFLNGLYPGQRP